MHNQQNHNHQEHHHAEGGCGCNHSHSKTQHGCSSEPKNAAAQAEHAHHHHDHGDSGCCTAAPDDPDEESDRLAAAPLPVANVSAGKSPVWTAPAAPRKSKMPSPHSPASTARACCSPPRNWWSTRSPTSACGSRTRSPAGFTLLGTQTAKAAAPKTSRFGEFAPLLLLATLMVVSCAGSG